MWQIPEGGRRTKGKPLINLLEDIKPEEKIATILASRTSKNRASILLATRKGVVKKTDPHQSSTRSAAKASMRSTSTKGMKSSQPALSMQASRSCSLPRTAWLSALMKLSSEPSAVWPAEFAASHSKTTLTTSSAAKSCHQIKHVLVVCENGYGKRSKVDDFRQTNRGGVGVRSIITSQRNGLVVGAISVTDNDGVVLMSAQDKPSVCR